jgi:hypothetical protein
MSVDCHTLPDWWLHHCLCGLGAHDTKRAAGSCSVAIAIVFVVSLFTSSYLNFNPLFTPIHYSCIIQSSKFDELNTT